MPYKVFIDGEEGTTGLKINEYFRTRDNIELLHIDREKRKDPEERLRLIKKADVSFLCLPDAASREIAAAAPGECRILDTSTAHRTSPQWVYGMPELCESQREKIRESSRVAVPGCHATGVILLIKPLLDEGMLSEDYPFSAFSITGYSGGGKKMIAEYRNEDRQTKPEKEDPLKSPRQYGITQHHKHLPEIMKATGLSALPSFIPVVADYYSGMEVIVPIKADMLKTGGREPLAAVRELFRSDT